MTKVFIKSKVHKYTVKTWKWFMDAFGRVVFQDECTPEQFLFVNFGVFLFLAGSIF